MDEFGDRMKLYERKETGRKFIPKLPVLIRLDGKSFHTFTKGLDRPYDHNFINCMATTTKYLCEESNALLGYCQSDEITLLLHSDDINSQIYFDGRIFKLNSVLASMATWAFSKAREEYLSGFKKNTPALFDCRSWQVPTKAEAANVFVWREMDAARNSVLMLGFDNFSHKQMHKLTTKQVQEKLFQEKGINWNDYPPYCKRGVYVQKQKVIKKLDEETLSRIPEKKRELIKEKEFERQIPIVYNMCSSEEGKVFAPLSRATNKVEVCFEQQQPIV